MKKIILGLGLLLGAYSSPAQVLISLVLGDKINSGKIEFGLDGGLNLSNLSGLPQSTNRGSFNLGFYFDIKMKNPNWMLNTGVIVKSPVGADGIPVYPLNNSDLDNAFDSGQVTRKLNYFYVPITMKYMFGNHFYLKGGIQLGLRNKCSDVFTEKIVDKDDLTYTLDIRQQYHPLDAGLAVGTGYRLLKGNGMNLSINYYHGLIDVEIEDATPQLFNRSVYFNVGIPIGKGKAAKKAEAKQKGQG